MTLTTLITINAVIGAAVVYGLVWLLAHSIRSDRAAVRADVRALRRTDADRIAA